MIQPNEPEYTFADRELDILRGGVLPELASHGIHLVDERSVSVEHARVFVFRNGGENAYYLASADWMTRSLSHRVEVAFPVLDPDIRQELRRILDLQIADDVKARIIDPEMSNMRANPGREAGMRAQVATRAPRVGEAAPDGITQVARFEETA